MSTREQAVHAGLIMVALFLAVGIYWPGLPGSFLVDDNANLLALNHNGGVTSWDAVKQFVFTNTSGALGRPISMLSFLINDQYFPGDVSSYRFTNLMIHCLVGLALLVFTRNLLLKLGWSLVKSTQVSIFVMLWWLLLPINVSTTLYVIQRMTQLSTLFVLLGLICYLHGRDFLSGQFYRGLLWLFMGFAVFGGLAVFSKENGVLIFLYALACELLIGFARKKAPHWLMVVVIALPVVAMAVYFIISWSVSIDYYDYRDFTLQQRLLTETRIVAGYLLQGLFSITSGMGLMQDDIVLSESLLDPVSTLPSVAFHCSLLCSAWFFRYRQPLFIFAVAWFYGGHLLESTFIPLELYFEHRNYLPLAGVLLAVTAWCWQVKSYRNVLRVGLALSLSHAALMTYQRASLWGNPSDLYRSWAYEHPKSLRAQTALAKIYLRQGFYQAGRQQLLNMRAYWPRAVHIDLALLSAQCYGNIQVAIEPRLVARAVPLSRYNSLMATELENIVEAQRRGVCPEMLDPVIHEILAGVEQVEEINTKVLANAAFWQAEIYIDQRNLNGAVTALDRSFSHYSDSVPLYMAANILSLAGLYDQALGYIERAIVFETSRSTPREKNISSYWEMKANIQAAM